MKLLIIKNQISGVNHVINFNSLNNKINIKLDSKNVGQINRKSGVVISTRQDVYDAVKSKVNEILKNN